MYSHFLEFNIDTYTPLQDICREPKYWSSPLPLFDLASRTKFVRMIRAVYIYTAVAAGDRTQ